MTSVDEVSELKEKVISEVDKIADELINLSKRIYQNPELKFEEYKAASWLIEKLKGRPFTVEKSVADLETAFRATCRGNSGKPTVAFLAEYDALPKLGHGCGHNLIAGASLGAALSVADLERDARGTVQLIGTPGEEGGGGKVIMVQAGVFDGVDAAMMVHPSDRNRVKRGSLAVSELAIDFYGKAAHASADPEKGINALDGAIQTFNSINAFREHMKDGARIHGIITDGGEKPNIVPEHAGLLFYVRGSENNYRDELLKRVKDCARGAALATGTEVEFNLQGHEYQAMKPNSVLADTFAHNLRNLGIELDEDKAGMGSTDMGDVSQTVPAIHPYMAIVPKGTAGHSKEFAAASNSERGYQTMLKAAKVMAMTALDLFASPTLMTKIKEEFENLKKKL